MSVWLYFFVCACESENGDVKSGQVRKKIGNKCEQRRFSEGAKSGWSCAFVCWCVM